MEQLRKEVKELVKKSTIDIDLVLTELVTERDTLAIKDDHGMRESLKHLKVLSEVVKRELVEKDNWAAVRGSGDLLKMKEVTFNIISKVTDSSSHLLPERVKGLKQKYSKIYRDIEFLIDVVGS